MTVFCGNERCEIDTYANCPESCLLDHDGSHLKLPNCCYLLICVSQKPALDFYVAWAN